MPKKEWNTIGVIQRASMLYTLIQQRPTKPVWGCWAMVQPCALAQKVRVRKMAKRSKIVHLHLPLSGTGQSTKMQMINSSRRWPATAKQPWTKAFLPNNKSCLHKHQKANQGFLESPPFCTGFRWQLLSPKTMVRNSFAMMLLPLRPDRKCKSLQHCVRTLLVGLESSRRCWRPGMRVWRTYQVRWCPTCGIEWRAGLETHDVLRVV